MKTASTASKWRPRAISSKVTTSGVRSSTPKTARPPSGSLGASEAAWPASPADPPGRWAEKAAESAWCLWRSSPLGSATAAAAAAAAVAAAPRSAGAAEPPSRPVGGPASPGAPPRVGGARSRPMASCSGSAGTPIAASSRAARRTVRPDERHRKTRPDEGRTVASASAREASSGWASPSAGARRRSRAAAALSARRCLSETRRGEAARFGAAGMARRSLTEERTRMYLWRTPEGMTTARGAAESLATSSISAGRTMAGAASYQRASGSRLRMRPSLSRVGRESVAEAATSCRSSAEEASITARTKASAAEGAAFLFCCFLICAARRP